MEDKLSDYSESLIDLGRRQKLLHELLLKRKFAEAGVVIEGMKNDTVLLHNWVKYSANQSV